MRLTLTTTALFLAFAAASAQAAEPTLTVKITGIAEAKGLVMVALENDAKSYDEGPLEKARFKGEVVKASGSSITVVFTGIAAGTYAIKAFHDANANSELDKNFLGIPTESYGFSNNASGTFGPAKFEDARFQYGGGAQEVEIALK